MTAPNDPYTPAIELADPVRQNDDDVDELELLTRPGREEELHTFLLLLHPADVADLIRNVKQETAIAILRHLDAERAAELVSELEPSEQERILSVIEPEELIELVGEMETDDAADLLQELDEQTVSQVLAAMPKSDAQEFRQLLDYDPQSAGGIMQTELLAVPIDSTVGTTLDAVRRAANDIDLISVFVVDDAGRYAGHVAFQDLVLSSPETPIELVMEPKAVEVTPDVDQEEVAQIFDHYSLVELGVVDNDGKLIGRITADDVHEVLVEEHEEDLLKLAGTAAAPEAIYSGKVWRIVGQRLPWLISTFLAGLLASYILHSASVVFSTAVVLLTFVPVITGMSGNVGTQSAMIMIRGMAMGHISRETLLKEITNDLTVGLIMGTTCGAMVTLIVGLWQQNLAMGLCVGVSLMFSMLTASLLGATEPPILKRFGIDPAVAAGPLITSINDVSGVIIYTLVSLFFLSFQQL